MNPRQRRGVLLLVLAGIGAIAVFAAVSSYVAGVRKDIKPKITVLVLRHSVPAFTTLGPGDVQTASIPRKWAPTLALHDPSAIGDRVAGTPLPAGSVLQEGMLVPSPTLQAGQREIAIEVGADTGVAGKISPGSLVDVLATFSGDNNSPASARVIVPRALVVTVGTPQSGAVGRSLQGGGVDKVQQVVPVTFALTPRQAEEVAYAESFATQVRLALIRPGDQSNVTGAQRLYTLPPLSATTAGGQ